FFKKLWENFGRFLKLGCIDDSGNHKSLTPVLRLYTSKIEEELKSAKSAPFLEKLVQKDIEFGWSANMERSEDGTGLGGEASTEAEVVEPCEVRDETDPWTSD
ncbi:hypothetical protein PIB30_059622, partial [Stylosanthes scabra]|nr:hypothetical protein [Stylosanthes scabra]